jgi:hypothetical protein
MYPNTSIVLAKHRQPPLGMPQPAFAPYGSMRTFEDTEHGTGVDFMHTRR